MNIKFRGGLLGLKRLHGFLEVTAAQIFDYFGKLQLIDATGSIDIVIHDLPSVWTHKDIYEKMFTIYIHCYMKDAKSRNRVLCPGMDMVENFKELENGKFHLLLLVHKFPAQQNYPGDKVVANNSSIYAEAIVLPWNLVVRKRDIDSVESSNGGDSFNEKWCDVGCVQDFPCTVNFRVCSDKYTVSLEFKSNGFSKYEHHDKDLVCTANDGKVLVNSKSHLWSVSFSADEAAAGLTTTQSFISSYLSINFPRTRKYCNLFPIKRHSNA
ncbi:hypothetical protein Tco_0492215 [Tanacetum coccineum]